jgi:predicted transcriptional regulator YdeE
MNYEIVTLDKKQVVGLSMMTTNENMQAASDIGGLWQNFMGQTYSQIENKIDSKLIAIYTDYEDDHTKPYRFMCGAEVSSHANSGLKAITVNPGKYAKFTLVGDMMTVVGPAWHKIWNMDLDRKYDTDFEYYHNDGDDPNNQTIEIYISLN